MRAPQIIYIVLALINLMAAAIRHGKKKTGLHSFPLEFVSMLIGFLILLWGGFFGGAR